MDNVHTYTITTQKLWQSKGSAHTGQTLSTVVAYKVMNGQCSYLYCHNLEIMVVKGHCSHWICFFHSCLIMENVHTCTATAQLLCSQRALVTLEMLFLELLNIKLSCEETMFTLPLSQLRNYGCQRALLTLDTLYPQLTHIKLCLDNAHTCTATTQKSLQSKGIAHTGYALSTVDT